MNLTEKDIKRFWSRVKKPLFGGNGCWTWKGGKGRYGKMQIDRKTYAAHRLSWIIHNGPIDNDDTYVCHHCDNGRCVRPDHLYLGDAQTNMDDKHNRGRARYASGENQGHSKLTNSEVVSIKKRIITGHMLKSIASDHGVNEVVIGDIARGATWRDVKVKGFKPNMHKATPKITDENTIKLRKDHANGVSVNQLAKKYKLSRTYVRNIIDGKKKKGVL